MDRMAAPLDVSKCLAVFVLGDMSRCVWYSYSITFSLLSDPTVYKRPANSGCAEARHKVVRGAASLLTYTC